MGERSRLISLFLLMIAGCGANPMAGQVGVFEPEDAGSTVAEPAAVGGGGPETGLVAPAQDPELRARIAAPSGLTIEVLTVACAGDCADVVAEGRGGNPPYQVKWEDGSTSALRHVCPLESGELKVAITDTAIPGVEFNYPARTATASVTSQVLECHAADGGMPEPVRGSCVQEMIAPEAADGCQRLTQMTLACPNIQAQYALVNADSVFFELPFPLQPGNQSCVVAFGNPAGAGEVLSFELNGISPECSAGQALWGNNLGPGSGQWPTASDPHLGSVLCLDDPESTYDVLAAYYYERVVPPALADLDLRICERCPILR